MKAHNLAVSLLAKYTCTVVFLKDYKESNQKSYCYASTFKVNENDFAIVKVKNNYKIVQILDVHEAVDLDLGSDFEYQFLISKIDISQELALQRQLSVLTTKINAQRTISARDQALQMLGLSARDVELLLLDSADWKPRM